MPYVAPEGHPMKRILLAALPLLLALPLAAAEPQEVNRNVRFGLPAPASKDRDAYLIERPQYVLSYNAKSHTPNWVCWRLAADDIGKAARGPFSPDPLLPGNIAKVTSHVYDASGFDRGHMCPAQDRSSTQADMDATFYTSNIVPQAPNNNQRAWLGRRRSRAAPPEGMRRSAPTGRSNGPRSTRTSSRFPFTPRVPGVSWSMCIRSCATGPGPSSQMGTSATVTRSSPG
jgi:DNA/RNA non-specific endonuclease